MNSNFLIWQSNNEEVRKQICDTIGFPDGLPTIVKKTKLMPCIQISRSKTVLQGTDEGTRRNDSQKKR